ncbi:hypothetical protein, partial [Agriterribacter sp.]|uniref:hypothetical protein n=1 Tax=Agriterribacter sp. TaxID=2821509 RepID=UPI002CACE4EC
AVLTLLASGAGRKTVGTRQRQIVLHTLNSMVSLLNYFIKVCGADPPHVGCRPQKWGYQPGRPAVGGACFTGRQVFTANYISFIISENIR